MCVHVYICVCFVNNIFYLKPGAIRLHCYIIKVCSYFLSDSSETFDYGYSMLFYPSVINSGNSKQDLIILMPKNFESLKACHFTHMYSK